MTAPFPRPPEGTIEHDFRQAAGDKPRVSARKAGIWYQVYEKHLNGIVVHVYDGTTWEDAYRRGLAWAKKYEGF